MDNMAYLQQIAGTNNGLNQNNKKGDNPLAKFFNIWTGLALVGLVIIIVIASVVAGMMNKVDTKDQDLMQQSYFMTGFMIDETFSNYEEELKNSDIRNMTASLKTVMNEIHSKYSAFMLDKYEIELDDLLEEELAISEHDAITELNDKLYQGKLNGILDRTFIREMTLQISYLRSYQSEIAERTKDEEIEEFALRAESNLANLYAQFHDFKSLTI